MIQWSFTPLALLLLGLSPTSSTFSASYRSFLEESYGETVADVLEREDISGSASFGGRREFNGTDEEAEMNHTRSRSSPNPVIIIHGVTNTAHTFFFVKEFLMTKGYSEEDIYATTYGDADKKWMIFVNLECQYIKQVRVLITSVHAYTGRSVDVLAYSMGAPITRKAILGGECIKDGDNLGSPLTQMVETFVSVAGANYGSSLCFLPMAICNTKNGLHCKSETLVGLNCCGRNCSSLAHSEAEYVLEGFDHEEVMKASLELQFQLLQRSRNVLAA